MNEPGEMNLVWWLLEEYHIMPDEYFNSSAGNKEILWTIFQERLERQALRR